MVAACALAFALASLQQDFAAYWVAGSGAAGWGWIRTSTTRWRVAPRLVGRQSRFRHSRFLYPPLAAELFRPLAALPYRAAKRCSRRRAVAAWIAAAALVARGRRAVGGVLVAGALFFPLYLHLERGQIDLLLLPLVLGGLAAASTAPALAGALFALAADVQAGAAGRAARARGARPLALGGGDARLLRPRRWSATVLRLRARRWCANTPARCCRARALYGEGGTDEMRAATSATSRRVIGRRRRRHASRSMDGSYRYVAAAVRSAGVGEPVPRLLAPESPSWPTSLLPYLLGGRAALAWAAPPRPRAPRR